ncbi:MAG TPA: hypothetical protein PL169_05060 [Leptospiraceae bacterium]|nr:hypothetical protein [Leptospiraceae bacterium]
MSPAFQPAEKNIEFQEVPRNGDYVLSGILYRTASEVFRSPESRFSSFEEFMNLVQERLKENGIFLMRPEMYFREVLSWVIMGMK